MSYGAERLRGPKATTRRSADEWRNEADELNDSGGYMNRPQVPLVPISNESDTKPCTASVPKFPARSPEENAKDIAEVAQWIRGGHLRREPPAPAFAGCDDDETDPTDEGQMPQSTRNAGGIPTSQDSEPDKKMRKFIATARVMGNLVEIGALTYRTGMDFEPWREHMRQELRADQNILPHMTAIDTVLPTVWDSVRRISDMSITDQAATRQPSESQPAPQRRQSFLTNRRIVICAAVVFTFLGMFPPWIEKIDIPYRMHAERSAGYSVIISPPTPDPKKSFANRASVQIDWSRLVLEWIVLGAAAATALYFVKYPAAKQLVGPPSRTTG